MSLLLHHYYDSETPNLDTLDTLDIQPQHHSNRSSPLWVPPITWLPQILLSVTSWSLFSPVTAPVINGQTTLRFNNSKMVCWNHGCWLDEQRSKPSCIPICLLTVPSELSLHLRKSIILFMLLSKAYGTLAAEIDSMNLSTALVHHTDKFYDLHFLFFTVS